MKGGSDEFFGASGHGDAPQTAALYLGVEERLAVIRFDPEKASVTGDLGFRSAGKIAPPSRMIFPAITGNTPSTAVLQSRSR